MRQHRTTMKRKPPQVQASKVLGEGIEMLPTAGDAKRLKGRLAAPAHPVTLDEMKAAIAKARQQAGRKALLR